MANGDAYIWVNKINIALVTPTPDDLFGYASDPGVRIDVEQCILIDQV